MKEAHISMAEDEQQLCWICEQNPVYPIASHFVPAGYLKNFLGSRNKEYMFSISPMVSWEEFYGRGNLENKNPEIKEMPFSKKGIFCKVCEKALGVWEHLCTTSLLALNELVDSDKAKLLSEKDGQLYAELNNLHPRIVQLFFYSLVWRQLLYQKLKGTLSHRKLFAELRIILNRHLHESPAAVELNVSFRDYPKITVYTTRNQRPVVNLVSPHVEPTDPYLFYLGPYNALVWGEMPNADIQLELPRGLFQKGLQLNATVVTKIAVVHFEEWMKPLRSWETQTTKTLLFNMAFRLTLFFGMEYYESYEALLNRTPSLKNDDRTYLQCITLAYEQILDEESERRQMSFDKTDTILLYGALPNAEYFTKPEIIDSFRQIAKRFQSSDNLLGKQMTAQLFNDVGLSLMKGGDDVSTKILFAKTAIAYAEMSLTLVDASDAISRNLAVGHYHLAQLTRDQEGLLEAISRLEKLLTAADSFSVHYNLGLAYKELSNVSPDQPELGELALRHIQQSVDMGELPTQSYHAWALTLMDIARGRNYDPDIVADASDKFEMCIRLSPTFEMGHLEYAFALNEFGSLQQSDRILEKADYHYEIGASIIGYSYNLFSQWANTLWELAKIRGYDIKLLKKSLELYEQNIAHRPDLEDGYINFAIIVLQTTRETGELADKMDLAIARLEKISTTTHEPVVFIQWGYACMHKGLQSGNPQLLYDAIAKFENAYALNRSDVVPLLQEGAAYFFLAQIEPGKHHQHCLKSAAFFIQALRQDNTNVVLLMQVVHFLPTFEQVDVPDLCEMVTLIVKGVEISEQQTPGLFSAIENYMDTLKIKYRIHF